MGSPTSGRRVLIVGCGVSGPVLAMFLRRAGIASVVYEGRPEPDDETGAFLNLAPNGLRVLGTLGVKGAVLAHGTPTTTIVFHNHRGRRLGILPETTTLIKRSLLCKALRETAIERGIPIEFGKRLEGVEIAAGGEAIARFEDGSEARGDLLVGCDGVHSRTRRSVMPDAPEPRYGGIIDSGGFSSAASLPPSEGVMRMTFGREGFFGYQVTPSGETYWFENFQLPDEPDRKELQAIPDDAWRKTLLDLHHGDHHPIPEIISSHEGPIGRWPSYDMPPLPTWHKGPVCLIGDAAHAALPSAGQGASLALEGSIVLTRCLRDLPDTRAAFAALEQLRKDRGEEVVEEARRYGNRKAPTNALTRGLRDLVLPFFLKLGVEKSRRAYAYAVDWDEKVA